ncbi:IS21 family transposase [Virgibacillus sp. 179-BFC.A HS]|uniref:IS21 family transposase n=1 Tax=Tigheibacillus jepli TaxID=3035914 RepID=A0ABU5CL87_9BACI|nr:IS21 family transposase [Virgibacillus sp. 179-BFC.A HS]MDY0406602.1 IS21 family transposase [Virgibacillus sp. 179-BFC.A HS]
MEIKQLLKQGFSKVKVAEKLGISRVTVYRYLKRNPQEMAEWIEKTKTRKKKLDNYKELILSWLREHPDMTAAQVFDWLTEKYEGLEVAESTVRLYVRYLRKQYDIKKEKNPRSHEAVPELPMGQQLQVDFGQTDQLKPNGEKVKLYVIAFVHSHSRYKYKEWLDRPFTTRDVIQSHENAFQYFGGITDEIVYDQDALILVSENSGDLILTREFQTYREERNLIIRMCRKADPQSKGKIENVVKYIKYNFAKNRLYYGLDAWNEAGWAWLERTGNYKIHHTTKKRPVEVFSLEKQHLRPISQRIDKYADNHYESSITRTVRKDNVIWYKSNRYSVPLGTFHRTKEVYIEVTDEGFLYIRESKGGPIIAKHKIDPGKGNLIQNNKHKRDRTKGIDTFIETVVSGFTDEEKARWYLDEIYKRKQRYIRDQLQLISKQIKKYNQRLLDLALEECMVKQLFSATDFSDVIQYLERQQGVTVTEEAMYSQENVPTSLHPLGDSIVQTNTQTRDINEYVSVLEGNER